MSRTPVYVRRFDAFDRMLHAFLMLSFLGLAVTGLPLLFSDQPWARAPGPAARRLRGGRLDAPRVRPAADHGVRPSTSARLGTPPVAAADYSVLWGPTSMVPQPRDLTDFIGHIRWFVGPGPRPRFDRFTYWEKFDYWAVFWGMGIIGGVGPAALVPGVLRAHPAGLGVQHRDARPRRRGAAGRRLHLHDALLQRPPAAREVPDGHGHLHGPRHARGDARTSGRTSSRASNARAASTPCAPTRRRTGSSGSAGRSARSPSPSA